MSVIEITQINIQYLEAFLNNTFPSSFRYFINKTSYDIIKNHYKTLLYIDNEAPIGYAHIDYDIVNNKYWFGICVLSEYQQHGIGTTLIKRVLEIFKESNIDSLYLTVDKSNSVAYTIYQKYGFKVLRETDTIHIMSLTKSNILYLPVSFGEAIDKLTILDIKMNKITDSRRKDVETEYNKLQSELSEIVKSIKFYYDCLKQINLQIWEDQDTFRYSDDNNLKTILCKKIIEDNDARFRIKNKINSSLNSYLKEQKGYTPKVYSVNYSSDKKYYKLLVSIIKYQSIFNDKVVINCELSQFEHISSIFSYDSSITISPTLDSQPSETYLQSLETSVNNKQFYNYISNLFKYNNSRIIYNSEKIIDNLGKIYFLTFANNNYMSTDRIINEAVNFKLFNYIISKSENDIPDFVEKHKEFIKNNPHGFGAYIWKPKVIYDVLNEMNENDILVYADAGSYINSKGGDRFKYYLTSLINDKEICVFGCNSYHAQEWVKMDCIMNYHPEFNNEWTPYCYAGLMIIKKTNNTVKLIDDFLNLCDNYYIDGSPSCKLSEMPYYLGHDRDNAIFNLCLSKYKNIVHMIYPDEINIYINNQQIHHTRPNHQTIDWSPLDNIPFQVRRWTPSNGFY